MLLLWRCLCFFLTFFLSLWLKTKQWMPVSGTESLRLLTSSWEEECSILMCLTIDFHLLSLVPQIKHLLLQIMAYFRSPLTSNSYSSLIPNTSSMYLKVGLGMSTQYSVFYFFTFDRSLLSLLKCFLDFESSGTSLCFVGVEIYLDYFYFFIRFPFNCLDFF